MTPNPSPLSNTEGLGEFDPHRGAANMSDNPMSVGQPGEAVPLSKDHYHPRTRVPRKRGRVTKNTQILAHLYKYTPQPVTLYT